jgi:hypothetical protein
MIINRNAEVALHGQAADIEWTMDRKGPDQWELTIEAVVDVDPLAKSQRVLTLTDLQASATLALFIGEMDSPINEQLYSIASPVWDALPLEFRLIP